ncbi:MAG: IS21 family transposase [Fimbriimonas sp.]|nr:IS21 family transposase [Fimbriimonas sp.]
MRKIREVLRLHNVVNASRREIALAVGIARSTVAEYLYRSEAAELRWPLPVNLSDEDLERLLFPPSPTQEESPRPLPDWAKVQTDLSRKGVTLLLLWHEYAKVHPNGYGYSRYASLYREWLEKTDLRMRQHHKAGEKLFVDFVGLKMPITDPSTGEVRVVSVFASAMGASQRIFAKAYASQTVESWLEGNADAFEFYGALAEILVPDNPKPCVTSPDRYEPGLNESFAEFARHYGLAVIPARPKKPRDKAKVENAVLQVERWVLAPLRDRTFFSLEELNREIAAGIEWLDTRLMKGPNLSRREFFEQIDLPAMRPLNMPRYQFATWKRAKVAPDYCVEFEGHRYSVPYTLYGRPADIRVSSKLVEVFVDGIRVCGHPRSLVRWGVTRLDIHMPAAHGELAAWTPERIQNWAAQTGPSTKEFVGRMMGGKRHPQQAFRSCMGVIKLAKSYTPERLEAACARALHYRATTYRNIKTILEKGLDKEEVANQPVLIEIPTHSNVRGALYYAGGRTCAN